MKKTVNFPNFHINFVTIEKILGQYRELNSLKKSQPKLTGGKS